MKIVDCWKIVVLAGIIQAPVLAARPWQETIVVRVHRPAVVSPLELRHLKRRIADAALEACGAGTESLAEVRAAIGRSACWQESYAAAMEQLGDGTLRLGEASVRATPDGGQP